MECSTFFGSKKNMHVKRLEFTVYIHRHLYCIQFVSFYVWYFYQGWSEVKCEENETRRRIQWLLFCCSGGFFNIFQTENTPQTSVSWWYYHQSKSLLSLVLALRRARYIIITLWLLITSSIRLKHHMWHCGGWNYFKIDRLQCPCKAHWLRKDNQIKRVNLLKN